ncbi:hypothetical protein YC2023_066831 [Brassica napus]
MRVPPTPHTPNIISEKRSWLSRNGLRKTNPKVSQAATTESLAYTPVLAEEGLPNTSRLSENNKPELVDGYEEQESSEDPQNRLVPPLASLNRQKSRDRNIGPKLRSDLYLTLTHKGNRRSRPLMVSNAHYLACAPGKRSTNLYFQLGLMNQRSRFAGTRRKQRHKI